LTEDNSEYSESEGKRLCAACVGELFLRAEIQANGRDDVCSYCGREGKTFTVESLADAVEEAIEEHFYRTPTGPSDLEWAMERDWYREGERVSDVIAYMAEIDAEPAEDILEVLSERHYDIDSARMGEECPFDPDAHYAEKQVTDGELQAEWAYFEDSLKTKARYFSRTATSTLGSIFEDIGGLSGNDGRPVIVEAGPGKGVSEIFRARVFQADAKLRRAVEVPDLEIGPPPSTLATVGRMNALGISVFYGATDPATAIAEVRPPVGSRVLVGSFEIIRPLLLLDVEALRSVFVKGSVFDRNYAHRLRRAKFLEGLSHRITKPVMPDDEPFDYLATQAIADFLASEAVPPLDGIIYPSVQANEGKPNVVLFHHAARVEPLVVPPGTVVSSQFSSGNEDDDDIEYCVWEEVPPPSAPTISSNTKRSPLLVPFDFRKPEDFDERTPTLKLDVDSLEVRHVQEITYRTERYQVRRHRIEKRPSPF
jgi:hypothetical protein